jgi:hypothetical protein
MSNPHNRNKIIIKFLLAVMLLAMFAGAASAATIDVGTSGYAYTSVQSGLNAAVAGDKVHVHEGTYVLTSTFLSIPSGVTLYGDGNNKTILKAYSPTAYGNDANPAMLFISGKSNVEVYGITFDGAGVSTAIMHDISNTYRNWNSAIKITSSSGTKIHDCYFTLTYGDSIRTGSGNSNTLIYNCVFNTPGHDGVSMWYGSGWRMTNCIVNTFINAGMRMENIVNGAEVDHCTFYSNTDSGSGGVEILNAAGVGLNVHHNIFRNMHNSDGYGIFFHNVVSGSITIANNIMYDCPGGYIVTEAGNTPTYTNTNNQLGASSSTDWVSQGYGYNASNTTLSEGGQSNLPPFNGTQSFSPISPTGSIVTVNGNTTFTWTNVNSTNYRVRVSTTADFAVANITQNVTTSSNSISLAESTGTRYWQVAAYIDNGTNAGTWTNYSSNLSFTVTGNTIASTGVYGVIYNTDKTNAIQGAVVTVWNGTWSDTAVTGADGYYSFSLQPNTGGYYMVATASDYIASQQMPLNLTGEYLEKSIALTKSPTYFAPHYTTVIVSSVMGTRYSGVNAYIVEGEGSDSEIAAFNNTSNLSGKTDDFGRVVFKLEEEKLYTVFLYDAEQNIDTHRTFTAKDSNEWVIVWNAHKKPSTIDNNSEPIDYRESEYFIWNAYSIKAVNTTHGFLNITMGARNKTASEELSAGSGHSYNVYEEATTITWTMNVQSVDANNISDGIFSYSNTGTGNVNASLHVPNNMTYLVTITALHPQLTGLVSHAKTVEVKGSPIRPELDFGWSEQWHYELMGYVMMLLLGGLFGARNINVGAILMMLMGFFLVWAGWFVMDTGETIMMMFGLLLVFVYVINRRD